jgi:hypothetical protein
MSKKAPPSQEMSIEQQLDQALHETLDENDALRAELARVKARLDALMQAFEKNGSLGILQQIATDKTLPPETRMRAAGLAVPYERPKYGSVDAVAVGVVDFREKVKQARLRQLEIDRARWAVEDEAKTLDHEPTGQTILGGDHGPEPDPEPDGVA